MRPDLQRRVDMLDSRITLIAARMVPLVLARQRREHYARELGITLPQVSQENH